MTTREPVYLVSEEVLRQVLDRVLLAETDYRESAEEAIETLRTILAKGPLEPVAWKDTNYGNLHHQSFDPENDIPLYALKD